MNVFRFEFKRLLIPSLLWAIALCLIFAGFALMFPQYHGAQQSMTQLMESFPPELKAAFNIDPASMFSLNGFFSFYALYLVLAAAIMACYFGISLMGREKIAKTSDFLMTRPQSRLSIFLEKLLAGIGALVLVNAILLAFLITIFYMLDNSGSSFKTYLLLCSSIGVIQLMLFSIGVLLGVFLPKIKVPAGIASSVAFAFFITGMVYGLIKDNFIRFFAPFQYINMDYIVKNGHYEWPWLGLCIAVIIVPIVVSAIWYMRRDIDSV